MRIQPPEAVITTFAGEGKTHRFAQGIEAISGVAAHEASNIVALSAQAARAGQVVVDEAIELQFALDPETGRLVVVGGRSRITFRPARSPELPAPPDIAPAMAAAAPGEDEPTSAARAMPPAAAAADALAQAVAAVEQRIAAVEQRLDGAAPAERPLLEAALRALRQRRDELELARRALERQETMHRGRAQPDAPGAVPGDGGAAAAGRGPGRVAAARPRPRVFIPAMTQSGLLVNASA